MKKPLKSISEEIIVIESLDDRPYQIDHYGTLVRPMPPEVVLRHLREFERISLRHKLFDNISVHFNISMDGHAIEMHIDAQVPDRATGNKTPLHAQHAWSVSELEYQRARNSMDFKLYVVRHHLRKFLEHELDEMLCLDGAQLKDPHAPDPPR